MSKMKTLITILAAMVVGTTVASASVDITKPYGIDTTTPVAVSEAVIANSSVIWRVVGYDTASVQYDGSSRKIMPMYQAYDKLTGLPTGPAICGEQAEMYGLPALVTARFSTAIPEITYPNKEFVQLWAQSPATGEFENTGKNFYTGVDKNVDYREINFYWEAAAPYRVIQLTQANLGGGWYSDGSYPLNFRNELAVVKPDYNYYGFGNWRVTPATGTSGAVVEYMPIDVEELYDTVKVYPSLSEVLAHKSTRLDHNCGFNYNHEIYAAHEAEYLHHVDDVVGNPALKDFAAINNNIRYIDKNGNEVILTDALEAQVKVWGPDAAGYEKVNGKWIFTDIDTDGDGIVFGDTDVVKNIGCDLDEEWVPNHFNLLSTTGKEGYDLTYATDILIERTYSFAVSGPKYDENGNTVDPLGVTVDAANLYDTASLGNFGRAPLLRTADVWTMGQIQAADISWVQGGYMAEAPYSIFQYLVVDGVVLDGSLVYEAYDEVGNLVQYYLPKVYRLVTDVFGNPAAIPTTKNLKVELAKMCINHGEVVNGETVYGPYVWNATANKYEFLVDVTTEVVAADGTVVASTFEENVKSGIFGELDYTEDWVYSYNGKNQIDGYEKEVTAVLKGYDKDLGDDNGVIAVPFKGNQVNNEWAQRWGAPVFDTSKLDELDESVVVDKTSINIREDFWDMLKKY